jgi:N-methylhydantoinase A
MGASGMDSPGLASIGVDTGGTFTDVVFRRDDGQFVIYKLLSTPDDPSHAIATGVGVVEGTMGQTNVPVIHGTTVATNALLERRGAKVAFVTTAGFEDLLILGRQQRQDLYSLRVVGRSPLVTREYCHGVDERVLYDGSVRRPLSECSVEALLEVLQREGYQAVAVSLLHSYANASHELALAEAIRQRLPDVHLTVSHELAPVFREYERGSTTVINGFVGPIMAHYLTSLETQLEGRKIEILQSHGGRADVSEARRFPVHTALSGPAGGVVGALAAAREVGIEKIIAFDMGGTSTDVSLCDGQPTMTGYSEIDGLPMLIPVIDIFTVGAGGGSIAYEDAGGALKVGPRSAGAQPGPAAYGRGGTAPTVTDAHVVLGTLRPDRFLGGGMRLDSGAAGEALMGLSHSLGLDVRALARGILDVADMAMSRAIKVISLERGRDPGDYTLVAFGGAGGLHGCRLARALGMDTVLIPRHPGALSAWGMLQAPPRRFYSATLLCPLEESLEGESGHPRLRDEVVRMAQRAMDEMAVGEGELQLEYTAELRYQGQSFEIALDVDWHPSRDRWMNPEENFARSHQELYGYSAPGRPIELVTVRLKATRLEAVVAATKFEQVRTKVEAIKGVVGFSEGDLETLIVERDSLGPGETLLGPVILTEYSGTTVIPPGWKVENVGGHLLARWAQVSQGEENQ